VSVGGRTETFFDKRAEAHLHAVREFTPPALAPNVAIEKLSAAEFLQLLYAQQQGDDVPYTAADIAREHQRRATIGEI
jgi:hypothetical protein